MYRPLYRKPHLDQVLFSIGLMFMAVAAVDYFIGSTQQIIQLPDWLKGRTEIGSGHWILGMGHYRLFIIAVCAALTLALQYVLTHTRFGSRLRASVDDQRVAAGLGINVNVVFLSTFAVGSGLAGLGGALGAEVLGLDPSFPLKFMIYFLIVVAVGGTSSITGPLLAALLLGIADVAGKYYIPKMGAFIVYSVMIAILLWRPQRPVRRGREARHEPVRPQGIRSLRPARRVKPWEPVLWLLAFASPVVFPEHALIINEIAIVALFAISLDLVLGYTGIVSLGHAAFFGLGAYTAALFAKHVMPDPHVGLLVAMAASGAARPRGQPHDPARHRPDAPDGDAGLCADPAGAGQQAGLADRRHRRHPGAHDLARAGQLRVRPRRAARRRTSRSPSCCCCFCWPAASSTRRSAPR